MDTALNVASTAAGVLSLAIQLVQLTQQYTSRMVNLPSSVACYLSDLTLLKQLLSDLQDGLALPPARQASGEAAHLALMKELRIVQGELENLQEKLHNNQNHGAFHVAKSVIWPFREDDTERWADNLRACRHRIESTAMISGLQLQLQTLAGIDNLGKRGDAAEQRRKNSLIVDWICDESWKRKHEKLIASHHPNTGHWIFMAHEFQGWVCKESGTLWCHGYPGTGKTQIM
ncbi:hypothetical protein F5Y07DRAFT_149629 [Xylaria sp. FL0933]|nr:hypothetical protein F5Y07DRAFT_149629 [Xylaria sp. FL0933]